MRSLLSACLVFAALLPFANAQTISTTLQLDSPNDPINVFELTLNAGPLGSDTQNAQLSGSADITVDLTSNGGSYDVTALTITGGATDISDVTFSLAFGISAAAANLSGSPFTTMPPSVVSAGSFPGSDHGFTINQGTVVAGGSTTDFMTSPFSGNGSGTGTVTTTPGTPVAGFDVLDVVLSLPISFSEPFDVPNVPILGTVAATFFGTGILQASGSLQIPVSSTLACDFDGDGDCELNDIDAMYAAIAAGTSGGPFDYDADGTVTAGDIPGWLGDASDASNTALLDLNDVLAIGDINFDGNVDSTDLGILLNNFNSTSGVGWGGGDLNADLAVDSTDLGQLLNEFGHTSFAASAVPEPTSSVAFAFICGWLFLARRRK